MNQLGALWPVSDYTLGGGGIGQVWGSTDRAEAIATVQAAVDHGVTLLDLAPMYGRGEAESVVGAAFDGSLPDGIRVTSKCLLATDTTEAIADRLEKSILRSLDSLRAEHIDLFFLHSQIILDDYQFPTPLNETQTQWSVTQQCFDEAVRPAFEALIKRGLIGAWGVTGTGHPDAIEQILASDKPPQAVQLISNLLDSPGGIKRYPEAARQRALMAQAAANGIGVMGIRAVQAGALCLEFDRPIAMDHPEMLDYERAAPFRALCQTWAMDPAIVAHRYALAMQGVSTVVLGVKNRQVLMACLDGGGPLSMEQIALIDALGLQRP